MAREDWTDASAGIRYDLSQQHLCDLGMNVVGCARNVGEIEVSLYGGSSFSFKHILILDLTDATNRFMSNSLSSNTPIIVERGK